MVTVGRRIFVPTVLLAAVVTVSLAYAAWSSSQQAHAIERDTQAVRAATVLAAALAQAAQEEERWVLTIPLSPGSPHEARLAEVAERIAEIARETEALEMPPRAAAVWRLFVEARPSLAALGSEVVTAARSGDPARLSLALEKWRLMSSRTGALLRDFSAYYIRLLDRMVAELHRRRVQALWTAAAAVAAGLVAAVALSAAVARAVVKPIVGIASAAEQIAETGRLAEVGGAERRDELGVLARSFNRMTERLLGANARLEEADRRKDQFLAMLSHELRNPLAPIGNALQLLSRPEVSAEQGRRARAVIERQVEHLTRIVDDLLDVTRIVRDKLELRRAPLNAIALVARVCEDYRPFMAEHGLALELEATGPVWVDADATRLAQVIGNLLHNAAKFTPRGGRVTVAMHASGDALELRVSDTGVGMDAALLGRIFEPFVQAEESLARTNGGLGLGLALVKGVVELHGGAVEARSGGAGAGSELVVRLPQIEPPTAASRERAPAPPRAASRRVLVVDDNVDAAVTLAELVALSGHTTAVAHDGPSALALARRDPPDVVLCDIGLPGMSGYDVARALRGGERGARVLLVAISGYAQPEDVRRALEAGFDRHLAKPPHPRELERLIDGAAGRDPAA